MAPARRRVVVTDDHARCIRKNCSLEYIPRVHDALIERSSAQFVNREQAMFRVHEQQNANLDGFVLKPRENDLGSRTRPTQMRQWAG